MADGVPSLNDRAANVAVELANRAEELGCERLNVAGAQVIDAGVRQPGSLAAGLMLARICLADLADVALHPTRVAGKPLPGVAVNVTHPVPACMASQYAGWQISTEAGYFAMGSGPFRAIYGKEPLYDDIGFREAAKVAVGVLEAGALPDDAVIGMLSEKLNRPARQIVLICARTASLAGGVQVVARSVETALHKLHELGFDLKRIRAGYGFAPTPPVARDDLAAIGRTNDAVLYGGEVTLMVTGDDDTLSDAARRLPASASRDYGRPFSEIFKRYDHDFYRIDPMLFSPAVVVLQNVDTGRTFAAGERNEAVLAESFFS